MRRGRHFAAERLEVRALLSGVPTQWDARGAGGGGALFAPQLSPFNTSELYIASDMGQLFHTVTTGSSWQTVDFREIQSSPVTQVHFTESPSLLYALDAAGDVARVTKSTDGGQTWTRLSADPLQGETAFKLLVDPANHLRMFVSDYSRLFFSGDGGATWSQKFSTAAGDGLHVAGAFFDGSNIYVGTSKALLVSSNSGQSFSVSTIAGIPSGEALLSLAGAKQNGVTRLVATTRPAANVYAGIWGGDYGPAKLYTLSLPGGVWTARTFDTSMYPFFVAMAQNNVNVAYAAGSSAAGKPTVLKTTDGGATWQSVFITTNNQNVATGWAGDGGDVGWTWNEAALGLSVATNDPNRVVITDYGFAHASSNAGGSWQQLYVAAVDQNAAGAKTPQRQTYRSTGLDNTSTWNITWTSAQDMIVSSSDIRGVQSHDGGQSFDFDYSGHARNSMYWSTVQPATGVVYAAVSSVHDLYQSTYLTDARIDGGNGAVLYSADDGHTWQTLHDFAHPVVWLATDPTNANRLYASVVHSTQGGIYVSNNVQLGAASTWTRLATPPRTEGHPFNIRVLNDGTLVVSYSGRRTSTAFTASSGVFVSTNGGQTWSDRSATGMRYWTKDVVIDPFDPAQNTWYAGVFSGWGGAPNGLGGLYKTTDRGVSWTRIVALDRVESVTVDPSDANSMYLTTETDGLWHSSNLRTATPTFSQVTSYPFRHPDRVYFNPYDTSQVWITSFGGGLRVGSTAADFVWGDMNDDRALNNLDIGPFEVALTDIARYKSQYPGVTDYEQRGDINHDGVFNNLDIQPFERALTNLAATVSSSSAPAAPALAATAEEEDTSMPVSPERRAATLEGASTVYAINGASAANDLEADIREVLAVSAAPSDGTLRLKVFRLPSGFASTPGTWRTVAEQRFDRHNP